MSSLLIQPRDLNAQQALDEERKIMAAYSDTAKTYSQLSLGALVLSVTFLEKVANTTVANSVDVPLLLAWFAWLTSALAGAFYQYLAVRFLEARGEDWGVLVRGGHRQWFNYLARHPWPVYAVMLLAFALGSAAFVIVGLRHLAL